MCTYDATQGYAPGQCATQQPNGQACIADAWCESGSCVDGVCAAPSAGALTFDALYELVFVEEVDGLRDVDSRQRADEVGVDGVDLALEIGDECVDLLQDQVGDRDSEEVGDAEERLE